MPVRKPWNSKPAFREAFKSRRCLVVADGFYEWRAEGKGPKQPYRFTMKDGDPFGMAGLWETWHQGDEIIESFTIIVGEPNDLVRGIHDRMPAVIPAGSYGAWLDGTAGKELLAPYPADDMAVSAVSTRVNSPANDDPGVIEPVASVSRSDETPQAR